MFYVETKCTDREPNIESYETEEEAEAIVKTCLKWGINIVSCKLVPKPDEEK